MDIAISKSLKSTCTTEIYEILGFKVTQAIAFGGSLPSNGMADFYQQRTWSRGFKVVVRDLLSETRLERQPD